MSMERNLKIYQAIMNRNLKIKKIKKKLKPLSDLRKMNLMNKLKMKHKQKYKTKVLKQKMIQINLTFWKIFTS